MGTLTKAIFLTLEDSLLFALIIESSSDNGLHSMGLLSWNLLCLLDNVIIAHFPRFVIKLVVKIFIEHYTQRQRG